MEYWSVGVLREVPMPLLACSRARCDNFSRLESRRAAGTVVLQPTGEAIASDLRMAYGHWRAGCAARFDRIDSIHLVPEPEPVRLFYLTRINHLLVGTILLTPFFSALF